QCFRKALVLHARFREGESSPHALYVAPGRNDASMDRLMDKSFRSKLNRRFAKHLHHERPYLFSFLYCPDLDATNNHASYCASSVEKFTGGGYQTSAGKPHAFLRSWRIFPRYLAHPGFVTALPNLQNALAPPVH